MMLSRRTLAANRKKLASPLMPAANRAIPTGTLGRVDSFLSVSF